MEKDDLFIKIGELGKLVLRLGNQDITKELENKIAILQQQLEEANNEKNRDLVRDEYNRLSKEIEEELEFEKKRRC